MENTFKKNTKPSKKDKLIEQRKKYSHKIWELDSINNRKYVKLVITKRMK